MKGLVMFLPLVVACGGDPGASDGPDASLSDGGAGDATSDGAPNTPDMAIAADGTTRLRIHYPAGAHAVSVRGDVAPLSWYQSISMSALPEDTFEYVLKLPEGTAKIEWKPMLDNTTWSRGPNYV